MTTNYIAQLKENMHLPGASLWLELAEAVGAVLNDAECIPLSDRVSVYESAMDKLYVTLNKLKGQQ